jgi:hypothetical protein
MHDPFLKTLALLALCIVVPAALYYLSGEWLFACLVYALMVIGIAEKTRGKL